MNYDEIEQLSETKIIELYDDLNINEYISGCDCCNVEDCSKSTNFIRHIAGCGYEDRYAWYNCKVYETSSRNFRIVDGITLTVYKGNNYNYSCDTACRNIDFSYGRWSYTI